MCDWGRDVESEKEGLINSIMGATSATSATREIIMTATTEINNWDRR